MHRMSGNISDAKEVLFPTRTLCVLYGVSFTSPWHEEEVSGSITDLLVIEEDPGLLSQIRIGKHNNQYHANISIEKYQGCFVAKNNIMRILSRR